MGRYIDADELIKEVEEVIEFKKKNLDGITPRTKEIYLLGMQHALDFIKVTPPIGAVRCKDCKHIETTEYGGYCCLNEIGVAYNDFCSHGERKKNNEQL